MLEPTARPAPGDGGRSAHAPLEGPPTADADPSRDVAADADPVAEGKPKKNKKNKKKKKKARDDGDAAPRLGSSRGIETMFRSSYMTHVELSSLADNKAGILISINGLIISIIIASLAPRIDNPDEAWVIWPAAALLVTCVVSIVYAILAARPRYRSSSISPADVQADRANILFFGNFVRLSEGAFVEGMTELMQDTDRLYRSMVRDLYGLGNVLARKYTLLRHAYTVFMVGLVASVLLFIVFAVFVGRAA